MNAFRTHLTRTLEQRPIHAAYLRRLERNRARHTNRDQAAAHHTPPVLLSIR